MKNRSSYLVTGASSGIGYELSRQLASEGHTVYGSGSFTRHKGFQVKCHRKLPDRLAQARPSRHFKGARCTDLELRFSNQILK